MNYYLYWNGERFIVTEHEISGIGSPELITADKSYAKAEARRLNHD